MAGFTVLVVCEGNLCRSPFAERLLSHRLVVLGAAERFAVTSAGTRAPDAVAMDARSAAALLERGASGAGFASRRLAAATVEGADLVLAASRNLRAQVLQESPGALHRTFTVLELAALAPQAPPGTPADLVAWCALHRSTLNDTLRRGEDYDVADPVGADQATYDQVVAQLDGACGVIAGVLAATATTPHLRR
ncbi:low molecular weight phosphatase family protein [Nocardioides mangrovicus]|uniref:protein-tyrosine-phosphatase n=1 Tax=Nocardioides mangrovicus TaxID=2478913 RepID=A0A3L8NXQ5_9ACTN|nr:low molecular weight phosphatase family protein [Nocardioides mangrovicus]RLV47621.1 low molecular weight phosphatase family protein [Nocardioides mangrovicus]